MLEVSDVRTKIVELEENYKNLMVSRTSIEDARKQLEHLIPLGDAAEKWEQIKQTIAERQNLLDIAPIYFARERKELLMEELKNIEVQLTREKERGIEIESKLENLDKQKTELQISISQDSAGQHLQKIKEEIQQQERVLENRKKKANEYDRLAKKLNLSQYENRDIFYEVRERGELLQREIEEKLKDLTEQLYEQKHQQNNLQQQCKPLESELHSLRQRTSQIPKRNLEIRDRITRELDLQGADLPFVGELLQVRSEYREWTGAIERLLRSFGLCVLVSEQHYRQVSRYVDRIHLGGRFVYYSIKSIVVNPMQRALDSQRVPSRLEIKQERSDFYHWLQDRLNRQFNYVCCETIEEFQREAKAITKAGLLKSGERHEKDDSRRIGDPSQYILGWKNRDKIEALDAELARLQEQLKSIKQAIEDLEKQQREFRVKESNLQKFLYIEDFTEIDWRSVQLELQILSEKKLQLETSCDRLKQLELQLAEVKETIDRLKKEKELLIGDIRSLEDRQLINTNEKIKCEEIITNINLEEIECFATEMKTVLRRYSLDLETIGNTEKKIYNRLQEQIEKEKKELMKIQNSIISKMATFRNAFVEIVAEFDTSLEAINEYLQLKDKIEQEDLPRHEQRFKALMNEKIITAISLFNASLESQYEEIENSINELNQSLQKIDYTDSTYIQLQCSRTHDPDIRRFREDLKICLSEFARQSVEDNEIRFNNIQTKLLEPFQTKERWTNKVTDVRNWLDFSVSEKYRFDDSEKEHHTDSSGKSGGQKEKLAYTILASAIAYQFGLYQDNIRAKSFHFVIIDEAFGKSDNDNARYAMELFKKLNLQLLVITPKGKINIIEPYISSLHYVSNTSEGNYSSVIPITIDEYRARIQSHVLITHDDYT